MIQFWQSHPGNSIQNCIVGMLLSWHALLGFNFFRSSAPTYLKAVNLDNGTSAIMVDLIFCRFSGITSNALVGR